MAFAESRSGIRLPIFLCFGMTNIRLFSWFSKLFVLKFVNTDPFLSGFRLNFQRLFRVFLVYLLLLLLASLYAFKRFIAV